ncbi:pentatricopeptide repeat-containing protein At5g66520-like [Nymphaea colorata]|nr:pentatricopeptide repeat-containing protein At5g66520-like [Nymphaea colorata]
MGRGCTRRHHHPLSPRMLQQELFLLLSHNCTTMRELAQIHAQIFLNGFSHKKFLLAKLVSFCATSPSGDVLYAYHAFRQVDNPSTLLWNQMIRGFSGSGSPKRSFALLNEMQGQERKASKPDSFTFCFLLNACRSPSSVRCAQQIHGKVLRNGLVSDAHVKANLLNAYCEGRDLASARLMFDEMPERCTIDWNIMVRGYIKCGNPDAARSLFVEMPERSIISWTTMISGCAQSGRCKEALILFHQMQRSWGVEIDQVVLVSVLSACAELGALDLGRWVHTYADRMGFVRNVSLGNALVHMYSKCGLIDMAYRVFRNITGRTVVSWTAMINGFAMNGRSEEALNTFHCMQAAGVKPDGVTFIAVLGACAHAGSVKRGWDLFKSMTRAYGIEPQALHYGCMVDLLGRAGHLDEAQKLMESMPFGPNDVVWGALLAGCRTHEDVKRAELAAARLVEMEPENAASCLVLMANTFAAAQRWDDLVRLRNLMDMRGRRKPPGCSWIEVDDSSYGGTTEGTMIDEV